jgi:hypothetical protein
MTVRVDAVFIIVLPLLAIIFIAIMFFRHHKFKRLTNQDRKLVKLYCDATFPTDASKSRVCAQKQNMVMSNERKLRTMLVS